MQNPSQCKAGQHSCVMGQAHFGWVIPIVLLGNFITKEGYSFIVNSECGIKLLH